MRSLYLWMAAPEMRAEPELPSLTEIGFFLQLFKFDRPTRDPAAAVGAAAARRAPPAAPARPGTAIGSTAIHCHTIADFRVRVSAAAREHWHTVQVIMMRDSEHTVRYVTDSVGA